MNPKDNPHLSDTFLKTLENLSASKRKRFLEGEYSTDSGALWKRAWIKYGIAEQYERIVVAVDPTGSVTGDECGIVVCGKSKGNYYALEDYSMHGTPNQWAAEVVAAYDKWKADAIVVEKNYGGDMVEATLRSIKQNIKIKMIWSSRGKLVRAEPISALYERGLVFHAKRLPELEDELCVVGNTIVLTENGELPIKDIKIGDRVFTRKGYKRVLWSGKTGTTKNLIKVEYNGQHILTTKTHPIYTVLDNSWKNAEDLCQEDIILGIKIGADVVSSINLTLEQKSMENQSLHLAQDGRPVETDIIKVFIRGKKVIYYIGRYGKAFMGKFLKICRYIIRMATDRITILKIWSVLRHENTRLNDTIKRKMLWPYQKKDEAKFGKNSGKICPLLLLLAQNVVKNTKLSNGGDLRLVPLNVERVVKLELKENVDVFNLRVEDCPEYFANGILVHNCIYDGNQDSPNRMDALVFGLSELSDGHGQATLTQMRPGGI
jgi:hypothetical protein